MSEENLELVILETNKGTARDEKQLQKIWRRRLEKVAPHYNILCVGIRDDSI